MRIAMTSYASFGGSASVASRLASALDARGHDVRFVALEPPSIALPPTVRFDRVEVPGYSLFGDGPYTVALASKLADIARDGPRGGTRAGSTRAGSARGRTAGHALDVIHVHYALPHAVSAYLARQMLGPGAPRVLVTMHGTDVTRIGGEPAYRSALRFAILAADARSVPSRYLAGAARRRFELDAATPIDVIANFVDGDGVAPCSTGARRAAAAELAGAPASARVLCHVSNFRRVKRAPDVIRVFAALPQRDARLLMVGDGPERVTAQALARELGVAQRIVWTGSVTEVKRYLDAADLFLLTSEEESFGLAALEALAAGVPVIATDVGGVSEVVTDGSTGRLVPLGDVSAMARAAGELLADDTLRARFSAAGHQDATRRFSLHSQVDAYEALYRRIITRAQAA